MVTLQAIAFSLSNQSGLQMTKEVTAPIALISPSLPEQIRPYAFSSLNYL
jgi:hypothetical protein